MDNAETLAMLRLRGVNLDCTLTALESVETPIEVKAGIDSPSPATRLRNTIFAWFSYEKEGGRVAKDAPFTPFYESKVDALIDFVKKKLPQ